MTDDPHPLDAEDAELAATLDRMFHEADASMAETLEMMNREDDELREVLDRMFREEDARMAETLDMLKRADAEQYAILDGLHRKAADDHPTPPPNPTQGNPQTARNGGLPPHGPEATR